MVAREREGTRAIFDQGAGAIEGAAVSQCVAAVHKNGQSPRADGCRSAVGVGPPKAQSARSCFGQRTSAGQNAAIGQRIGVGDTHCAAAGSQADAPIAGQSEICSGKQGAAIERQSASACGTGAGAQLVVSADGHRARADACVAGVGVGATEGERSRPRFGQRASARHHAAVAQRFGAVHTERAASGQADAPVAVQGDVGGDQQGAAVQRQVCRRGRERHGAQVAVCTDGQGPRVQGRPPGEGVDARQGPRAGAVFGQAPRARNDAGVTAAVAVGAGVESEGP